jgi:hypothetical protein
VVVVEGGQEEVERDNNPIHRWCDDEEREGRPVGKTSELCSSSTVDMEVVLATDHDPVWRDAGQSGRSGGCAGEAYPGPSRQLDVERRGLAIKFAGKTASTMIIIELSLMLPRLAQRTNEVMRSDR